MRMRATTSTSVAFLALALSLSATASPIISQRDTESCTSEDLTTDTWTSLNLDSWLSSYVSSNLTGTSTNYVQELASSFGAPNFFCGLDSFCNAGQPCVPVDLPAWYVLVAVQNWNSYMNSLNTAIIFASSIMSLTLPGIVSDFYPSPSDDVTPLKDIIKGFTAVLGIVPFTGTISTAVTVITGTANFISGQLVVPEGTDLFVAWSDISSSLATVVSSYQASVSDSITKTLATMPNDTTYGIDTLLTSGRFLGVTQNFTQSDLQTQVTSSLQTYSIALILQAQKIFIYRSTSLDATTCPGGDTAYSEICVQNSDGTITQTLITKNDGDGNAEGLEDLGKKLTDSYGIPIAQYITSVVSCYDNHDKQQLTDLWNTSLPLDSSTECLFNLIVCDMASVEDGIVEDCQNQGLDV